MAFYTAKSGHVSWFLLLADDTSLVVGHYVAFLGIRLLFLKPCKSENISGFCQVFKLHSGSWWFSFLCGVLVYAIEQNFKLLNAYCIIVSVCDPHVWEHGCSCMEVTRPWWGDDSLQRLNSGHQGLYPMSHLSVCLSKGNIGLGMWLSWQSACLATQNPRFDPWHSSNWAEWHMLVTSLPWRQRQRNKKFKVFLSYTESSRSSYATWDPILSERKYSTNILLNEGVFYIFMSL